MFLGVITLQCTFGWWRFEFLGNGHWDFFFRDWFLQHFKISTVTDLKTWTRFLKRSENKKLRNTMYNTTPPNKHTVCVLPLQHVSLYVGPESHERASWDRQALWDSTATVLDCWEPGKDFLKCLTFAGSWQYYLPPKESFQILAHPNRTHIFGNFCTVRDAEEWLCNCSRFVIASCRDGGAPGAKHCQISKLFLSCL